MEFPNISFKNIDDIYDFRRTIYKWCLSDQAMRITGQLDL